MLVLLYFLCLHGHTKVTNIYLGSLCVREKEVGWGKGVGAENGNNFNLPTKGLLTDK